MRVCLAHSFYQESEHALTRGEFVLSAGVFGAFVFIRNPNTFLLKNVLFRFEIACFGRAGLCLAGRGLAEFW